MKAPGFIKTLLANSQRVVPLRRGAARVELRDGPDAVRGRGAARGGLRGRVRHARVMTGPVELDSSPTL